MSTEHGLSTRPIYEKGFTKRIIEERMFIGRNQRNNERIDEYLRSFEDLWERGRGEVKQQELYLPKMVGVQPVTDYERFSALSLEYFDKTYYAALKDIVQRHPELDDNRIESEHIG